MAGPHIMALGPFQFTAMENPYSLSLQNRRKVLDTPWTELDVVGAENQLQFTGPKSRSETIRGVLFSAFGGGSALNGLKLAARNGVPLPFVDLGGFPGNVFGMHVVEGVSEDHGFIDAGGRPLRNAYTINIRQAQLSLASTGTISVMSLFA